MVHVTDQSCPKRSTKWPNKPKMSIFFLSCKKGSTKLGKKLVRKGQQIVKLAQERSSKYKRPALHIALLCVKIIDLPLPRCAPGRIRTYDPSIIDKAMWSSSVWVKRCHSLPNWTSRSGAKCKKVKWRATCLSDVWRGATVDAHKGSYPLIVAIGSPSLSRIWPLVWPAVQRILIDFCKIARGTCHVQSISLQPASSSFRRSGASNEYAPVPIGPAIRAPEAKMLGHT